jgi:hypothetical protein
MIQNPSISDEDLLQLGKIGFAMATISNVTEISMRLRLSPRAQEQLAKQAHQLGLPVDEYASELLEQAITHPTVDELLTPFRKQVADSGMSDEELDVFFEDVREKAFQERRRPA